ncbi:MAG: hypothetical protein ACLFR8_05890 [Alkalispirochaeta sp.]
MTATVLSRFPAPLTGKIGRNSWTVSGDATTGLRGDAFTLSRDDRRFETSPTISGTNRDVLSAPIDDLPYLTGWGVPLLAGSTGGAPYHLAIVAVALVLEGRSGGHAFLQGDIDRFQIDPLRRWVNAVLPERVSVPVCLDAGRLLSRLLGIYRDTDNAVRRFRALYLGSEGELQGEVHRQLGEDGVRRMVRDELRRHASFLQLRPASVILNYLDRTEDPGELVRLSDEMARAVSPGFGRRELVTILARAGVTVPREQRPGQHRSPGVNPIDEAEERFGAEYYRTRATMPVPERYIPREELLDLVAPCGAPQRGEFAEIIDLETRRYRRDAGNVPPLRNRSVPSPIDGEQFIRRQIDLARRLRR